MKSKIFSNIVRMFVLMLPYNPKVSKPSVKLEVPMVERDLIYRRFVDDRAAQFIAMSGRFL